MFTILHKFIRELKALARDERGMTLPLLAISMVAITAMTGVAIDTGRMQMVQSKLQFSLDAAGLAAGSTVSTSTLNSEVTKYLAANFNGYLGSTMTGSSATVDNTNTVITLSATAQLPTTFMGVVGINTITVTANSQISRAVTGLELVLVLDNTGSMTNSAGESGVTKLQALQSAANTLVSSLFASNPPAGKLWVGIVPFTQAVNIGTGHPTWMNTTYDNTILDTSGTTSTTDWGPSGSWMGCVDARQNSEDTTDDPPSSSSTKTLFESYYWTSDSLNSDGVSNGGLNNWKQCTPRWNRCKKSNGQCSIVSGSCSTQSNTYTCTATTPTCTYNSNMGNLTSGPNYLCPQQVTPMTNNQSTLTSAINAMTAQGDTIIPQGLQWGWNMLSPRWQGQWGGTMNANGLPLAYNTKGMTKVVVLLTDGTNTIDNNAHGAYWFLGDDRVGTTNGNTAVTTLNTRTSTLCTAMKNAGIYIYTIALGTDPTQAGLSMLQSCATANNYYFDSPSTSQLQSVFSAIGDSLSNLRVSK
jgi:Flp pilus assembly protein TadG